MIKADTPTKLAIRKIIAEREIHGLSDAEFEQAIIDVVTDSIANRFSEIPPLSHPSILGAIHAHE